MFEFKGLLRTLSSAFAFAAMLAPTIPAIAPYAEAITLVAGWLGGAGIVRAGVRKAVK